MRTLLGLLLLFLAVPLQVILSSATRGFVDLSLVATYFCGLYFGKGAGLAVGGGLGIFLDGCTLGPPGQHLIGRAVAGYVAGALGERTYARGLLLHLVALTLLTGAVHTLEWLLLPLAGGAVPSLGAFFAAVAVDTPLTAAAGTLLVTVAVRLGLGPRDTTYYPHR